MEYGQTLASKCGNLNTSLIFFKIYISVNFRWTKSVNLLIWHFWRVKIIFHNNFVKPKFHVSSIKHTSKTTQVWFRPVLLNKIFFLLLYSPKVSQGGTPFSSLCMNNDVQINPFFRPESSFVTTCMSISRNYFAFATSFFLHTKSLKPIRLQYIRTQKCTIRNWQSTVWKLWNISLSIFSKFRENNAFRTKLHAKVDFT